jgi:hypothetical protein
MFYQAKRALEQKLRWEIKKEIFLLQSVLTYSRWHCMLFIQSDSFPQLMYSEANCFIPNFVFDSDGVKIGYAK